MVRLLLRKGGDPEACGTNAWKPLLPALSKGHEEIAIFLFSKMNDSNTQIAGDAGYTPLHMACLPHLPISARVFLGSGADVNATTSKGSTSLHFALTKKSSNQSRATTPESARCSWSRFYWSSVPTKIRKHATAPTS